jgi:trehalose 6-phosphate phosphatase
MSEAGHVPDMLSPDAASLWARVASADRRLLLMDYDGTLAPLRVEREEARPLPGIVSRLRVLASEGQTGLAVVSGRPIADLEGFLGSGWLTLVGEHGWEMRRPDGRLTPVPLPEDRAGALERAAERAIAAGYEDLLEHKRCCLVLHTRALPPEDARAAESACGRLWEPRPGSGLRLDRTGGGLELRATDRTKGTALRDLIAESPPGALAVYVGDDTTDEEAFAAARRHGFGVRVGAEERRSLADARLLSVDAVAVFLETWLDVVREAADRRRA